MDSPKIITGSSNRNGWSYANGMSGSIGDYYHAKYSNQAVSDVLDSLLLYFFFCCIFPNQFPIGKWRRVIQTFQECKFSQMIQTNPTNPKCLKWFKWWCYKSICKWALIRCQEKIPGISQRMTKESRTNLNKFQLFRFFNRDLLAGESENLRHLRFSRRFPRRFPRIPDRNTTNK